MSKHSSQKPSAVAHYASQVLAKLFSLRAVKRPLQANPVPIANRGRFCVLVMTTLMRALRRGQEAKTAFTYDIDAKAFLVQPGFGSEYLRTVLVNEKSPKSNLTTGRTDEQVPHL